MVQGTSGTPPRAFRGPCSRVLPDGCELVPCALHQTAYSRTKVRACNTKSPGLAARPPGALTLPRWPPAPWRFKPDWRGIVARHVRWVRACCPQCRAPWETASRSLAAHAASFCPPGRRSVVPGQREVRVTMWAKRLL